MLFNLQTEEEKVSLERKTREAEQLTARLVDESERRAAEANKLKEELHRARVAEKLAKEKLLDFLSRKTYNNTVDKNCQVLIFFKYLNNGNIFVQSVSSLYSVSSSSVLDLPADLHALRLNANSPSLSIPHSSPPAHIDLPSYDFIADNDMEQLSLEIEKER